MANQITERVLNLKTEIERFTNSIRTEITENVYKKAESDERYAPKNHAWKDDSDYGTATYEKFGHVKRVSSISSSSTDNNSVPDKQAVTDYVTSCINNLRNQIDTDYLTENTGEVAQLISTYNIESKLKRFSIASTYQKPNNYATSNDPLSGKIKDDDGVDAYIWAGHYHILNGKTIQYGNLNKSYTNGLLDVRVAGDKIIQELYTTIKGANNKNVLSGEKYTRTGTIDTTNNTITFSKWSLAYMPYSTSQIIINISGTGISNMSLKENTSGYIIEWDAQTPYTLEAESGEEKEIASFSNKLNINNDLTYNFPSYMGGFEIKVNQNHITIVSNKQKGSAIDKKYLKRNYFIPRAG